MGRHGHRVLTDEAELRRLRVIESVASACDLEDFCDSLLAAVPTYFDKARATVALGSAPERRVDLSDLQSTGIESAWLRRYSEGLSHSDPFRTLAGQLFQRTGVVALDHLHPVLDAQHAQYVSRFLGGQGVYQQISIWLGGVGDVHGYLTVLDPPDGVLDTSVGGELRLLRPVLRNLFQMHVGARRPELKTTADCTPAEHRVVSLVLDGSSNKLIARTLGISEHTVKKHLTSVYRRNGLSSRTELMRRLLHE